MSDLTGLAKRAVEQALAAGAGDAEAFVSEAENREVRVHGGEVESLTAATQRGLGLRIWIGGSVGYGFGTDLSPSGVEAVAVRAVEAAQVADEDEFAAPAKADSEPPALEGLSDPSHGQWSPAQIADLALSVERTALEADARIAAVEQAVYFDSAERVAIASSAAVGGDYATTTCRPGPRATAVVRPGSALASRAVPPTSIRLRSAAKAPSALPR
jgi:PmbA protein